MVPDRDDDSVEVELDAAADPDPSEEPATALYEPATRQYAGGMAALEAAAKEGALPPWAQKALARADAEAPLPSFDDSPSPLAAAPARRAAPPPLTPARRAAPPPLPGSASAPMGDAGLPPRGGAPPSFRAAGVAALPAVSSTDGPDWSAAEPMAGAPAAPPLAASASRAAPSAADAGHGAPPARAPREHPALGEVLAGRYRLERLIGIGGMADVFEAIHEGVGRRVAVKLVAPALDVRADVTRRLVREARAAAALESEHVVAVLDVGEDARLGVFLVMELLRGQDLERVLAARGRMDPVAACEVAVQCCRALEKAHAAGIVHRDLKPSNVVLGEGDDGALRVKVVDFGIAKVLEQVAGEGRGAITRTGAVVGTPQYMAPEQARGLDTVDARADVYALGAVLYEMLAGKPPFAELPTYEQTMLQVMTQPAPSLAVVAPHVPAALVAVVDAMMQFDRAARVASARDARARIEAACPALASPRVAFRGGEAIVAPVASASVAPTARSIPAPEAARARAGLSRRASVAAVAALVALLIANVAVLFAGARASTRASAAATASPAPVEESAPVADAGTLPRR